MSPMSSSSAKITAATGVLNAAARAPAAPTGTSSWTRCGGRPTHRPITEARPAPICTDGPSRPIECPDPDAQRARQELADRNAQRNHPALQVVRRLGLRHAAAAHVGKHRGEQHAGQQAHAGGHEQQSRR